VFLHETGAQSVSLCSPHPLSTNSLSARTSTDIAGRCGIERHASGAMYEGGVSHAKCGVRE